ncbi:MAG: arsenate reductase ArsC [Deltaproteobacteria bacterium]|nr:arsenate reductase ArsC [Deltaproteobacteria bacterium]
MSAPWEEEAQALRAQAPSSLLFLCVANSARSQLAEAIARHLAPPGVSVQSAGSVPTAPRPEALAVLHEAGIPHRSARSKGLDEVDPAVEVVITLCAEEVCPLWLGSGLRLHWGLPDPAGGGMDAFRATRDELLRRLAVVFGAT